MERFIDKVKFFIYLWKEIPRHFWLKNHMLRSGYILIRMEKDGTYEVEELATGTFDRKVT